MTELMKYSPNKRDVVKKVLDDLSEIAGYEKQLVFEESTTFSKGYRYFNGELSDGIFVIDDPTYREPFMVFTASDIQGIIKHGVKSAEKSS